MNPEFIIGMACGSAVDIAAYVAVRLYRRARTDKPYAEHFRFCQQGHGYQPKGGGQFPSVPKGGSTAMYPHAKPAVFTYPKSTLHVIDGGVLRVIDNNGVRRAPTTAEAEWFETHIGSATHG